MAALPQVGSPKREVISVSQSNQILAALLPQDSLKKIKKMSLMMLLVQLILRRPARKKPKLRPLTLLLPLMHLRPP